MKTRHVKVEIGAFAVERFQSGVSRAELGERDKGKKQ
jgi:hypothetical protein